MADLVYSPLKLVDKAGQKGQFRSIDLSYPHNEQSVNACIPPENPSVQYKYIDDAVSLAITIGKTTVAVRLDAKHAFRNLPLHVSQIRVLAFTLDGVIYLNVTLPFGAASSCLIFEKVASLLQWIIITKKTHRYSVAITLLGRFHCVGEYLSVLNFKRLRDYNCNQVKCVVFSFLFLIYQGCSPFFWLFLK